MSELYDQFHHNISGVFLLLVNFWRKTPFSYTWNNLLINLSCMFLRSLSLHFTSAAFLLPAGPSLLPVLNSAPLKSHRCPLTCFHTGLFSTVIPDNGHSCGAKIDLHPCVIGSARQDSQLLLSISASTSPACDDRWNPRVKTWKSNVKRSS